ncbi:MAG: phosphate ABC transporter permease PstA, partial [Synergistaceae bacterium]|nr:phosphate ABC transporter permease PstA [Synergistaceae bacterium]
MRRAVDKIVTFFLCGTALLLGGLLFCILGFVVSKGWPAISWSFIFEPPRDGMTSGGIWTPLVGTLQLIVVSMIATIPIGVGTGLYFSEYAGGSFFTSVLRQSIRALAGVPSVVFGLFGLSLFVIFMGFGSSLLSASLTLACLSLPLMVTASEQAFRAVPRDYRDASYALGATKWQTIRKVVLPAAAPTIITGGILSIGRVAGETAPIIFTGAAFFTPGLAKSLFEEVMALPYHVYVLATAGTNIEMTRHLQYGSILVLMALVLGISSIGVLMRIRLNRG